MTDDKTEPPHKSPFANLTITRNAEDSDLTDWDYAFIFDKDGNIRAVQFPFWLEDAEPLPDHVARVLDLVATLKIIDKDMLH
jgi:hypothetical protein